MSETNFDIGEMKLITSAFLGLVFINAVFFYGGILGDSMTATPPTFNATNQSLVTAGEFPQSPSQSPVRNVSRVLNRSYDVTYGSEWKDLDRKWLSTSVEARPAKWNEDNQSVKWEFQTAKGHHKTSTWIAEGEEDNVTIGNYHIKVTTLNVKATDQFIIDGRFEVSGTEKTGNGFFAGLKHLSDIIGWGIAAFFEIAISVVLTITDMVTFVGGLLLYLVRGWIEIGGELNETSPFLTLVVFGIQLPLYLLSFNGVMKIVKALPFT